MSRRRWLMAVVVTAGACCITAVSAQASPLPARYTVTVEISGWVYNPADPRTPGFTGQKDGHATGINNAGQLAGWFFYYPTDPSTLAWGGGPRLGMAGGLSSEATAINDAGVTVGWAGTSGVFNTGTPAAWDSTGFRPILGSYSACAFSPANCLGQATDINNSGQIVGWVISNVGDASLGIEPAPFGFFYDPGTGVHRLSFRTPTAINDEGDIVGTTAGCCPENPPPGPPESILYQSSTGTTTDLTAIFGGYAPTDINDNGDILGGGIVYNFRTGVIRPALSTAINNHGDTVGGTEIEANGHVVDLNTLVTGFAGTIVSATDINDSLQISADVVTPDGVTHGALLTPVTDDTPPTCMLMATVAGPPKQLKIAVQDTGTGIQSITHDEDNASVDVPSFTTGTNDPLMITATKTHSTQPSTVALTVTDAAGNKTVCDPRWPASRRKHR